ncbi:MAG: hypothetical protein LUC98_01795 [Lachnospiraceae bacterium]|nr:hypothetical protein [Lachnospiraceae bacterium]
MGESYPTFTPPNDSDNGYASSGAPIFTPPGGGMRRATNAVCYHHPSEPAAAQCARCGKYICRDCAEAFGVSAGEYANKSLCYDCCEAIIADNVAELTKNKRKIKAQFILSIIGMVLGGIFGIAYGASAIGAAGSGGILVFLFSIFFFACIGGVFLSAIKAYFAMIWEAIKLIFSGDGGWIAAIFYVLIQCFVVAFKCIWATVTNTISYIQYLKHTSNCIEEDTAALAQIKEYMEYMTIRLQNADTDLDSLMNEGGQLANNSYARMVRTEGEQAADAAVRRATTTIAENGEIIRGFAA